MLETALELYGGKAVLNSINFEDGEAAATARMTLARKFGAAVIALTIDEAGMAKSREDKLRITRRLVEFACGRFGLPQSDLLLDPLTFTICTGNEDDRKLALWTLEAIEDIRARVPGPAADPGPLQRLLRPQPRRPARAQLGDARPCHAARPHRGDRPRQQDRAAAQDPARGGRGRRGPDLRPPPRRATIRCRRSWRCSPTARPTAGVAKVRPETIEEQLKLRIVDGDKQGLEADLDDGARALRAAGRHQRHPARRHEDRGRAVRRRQDAAAVRAAVGRDHEEGRGLSRAA